MMIKRLVLVGAGIALVLGGTAAVLDNMAHGQGAPAAGAGGTATPGRSQVADGSTPSSTDPSGTGRTSPPTQNGQGTVPGGGDAGERGPGSGDPGEPGSSAAGNQRALEVLPPVSASPGGLPIPSPPAALVNAPLPSAASAKGKTVEGFPSHILSFPDRTVVVFTAVTSNGDTLQATAEGIVELAADKVTGHFQQVLQAKGFRSEEAPAVSGQAGLRLARGTDSVTLTLSTTGTGSTRFSLLGTFHTQPGS
jgi:hypothetical protein